MFKIELKNKRPKLVSFLNNETFQNCLLKSLLTEKEQQKPQRELPNFLATKKNKAFTFHAFHQEKFSLLKQTKDLLGEAN